MTYHWVCRAQLSDGTGDGAPAVVKVGLGDLAAEAAALRGWGGEGAVRLLRRDLAAGALLLGACRARHARHRPAPGRRRAGDGRRRPGAPPVARGRPPAGCRRCRAGCARSAHTSAYPGGDRLVPRPLVEQAVALVRELRVDAPPDVLLHGDLHHDNVLRTAATAGSRSTRTAPSATPATTPGPGSYNPTRHVGEPAPHAGPGPARAAGGRARARVDRLAAWGFVKAVLSAVWTADDTGRADTGPALEVAALLQARLP